MNDDEWYFNLDDHTVHRGKDPRALNRMGPYPDEATARQALEIAKARNAAADSADDKWENG